MYAGRLVEFGPTETIFEHPRHPYTAGSARIATRVDERAGRRLKSIKARRRARRLPTGLCISSTFPHASRNAALNVPELRAAAHGQTLLAGRTSRSAVPVSAPKQCARPNSDVSNDAAEREPILRILDLKVVYKKNRLLGWGPSVHSC